MSFRRLMHQLAVVAVAVTATSAIAASQAQASPTSTTPATKTVVKRGMYISGFDTAVAKAHGYKIVTYANGDRQAVPVNPRSSLPKGPVLVKNAGRLRPANSGYDSAAGNCGTSWIYGDEISTSHISLESGFDLTDPAVAYNWVISLNDANGTSEQSASGTLLERKTWEGTWNGLYQYEYTIDEVLTSSTVVLYDGSTCSSAGPYIVLSGLS